VVKLVLLVFQVQQVVLVVVPQVDKLLVLH
jgi:hypothetical protein